MKQAVLCILVSACLAPAATAGPVSIFVEQSSAQAAPGSTVSFLFLIRETEPTPVFGYSLDINVAPEAGALGAVTANIDLTNFFDQQNLITAGGVFRDPVFSQIFDPGDGGVFITTNTHDDSTVSAVDGVNDVLARVFFEVSADALGDFAIDLGPASAIGDNPGLEYIDPASGFAVDQNHAGALALTDQGLGCRACHTVQDSDKFEPPQYGGFFSGSMETLVPQRGGVNTPTPIPRK